MNYKQTLLASLLLALMAVVGLPAFAQNKNQQPIITFHTTVYEENKGESPIVTFSLGSTQGNEYVEIDCGNGPEELAVGVAKLKQGAEVPTGTDYSGTVTRDGIVKIYGDPSKIDFFNATGCKIDQITFHKDLKLSYLRLAYNSIKQIDLSNLKSLQFLYLRDNPFSAQTPLRLGNMPELLELEIAQCAHVQSKFELKNFPKLVSFDAYHCRTITEVDTKGCTTLRRLSLDMTDISTIDVSHNANLNVLNVSDTRVNKLDISKNSKLNELYIEHASGTINTDVKFDDIDLTHCPDLRHLYCAGNTLRSLNLSKVPKLVTLGANHNKLTSIDVSKCPDLYIFNIRKNLMTFASLPKPQNTWREYYYDQRDLVLDDTYKVGTVLDFTKQVLREGTTTLGKLYKLDKDTLAKRTELDASYYYYENGKVTLLRPVDGKVVLIFTNTIFNEYPLFTEPFTVKDDSEFGKDVRAIDFATTATAGQTINLTVGMKGATPQKPVKVKVDFGNGQQKEVNITAEKPTAANITGQRAGNGNIVVTVPQDNYVTALEVKDLNITSIDVTELTDLRVLSLVNTGLTTIDLGRNNQLERLDLSHNQLKTISLKGKSKSQYKSLLTHVNLSYNQLETITVDDYFTITDFDLSHNNLANLDLRRADALVRGNLSYNKLTSLILDHSEQLKELNVSNNELTLLGIIPLAPVAKLDISNNHFTLANMPNRFGLDEAHFTYAPQHEVVIATTSPGIDLTEQYVTINNKTTNFVWKTEGGQPYVLGTDYLDDKGSTRFKTLTKGKVYCEISHPAYPAFTGKNILKTTLVQPIPIPTNELASFTTTNNRDSVQLSLRGNIDGMSVYFDWRGDGAMSQYVLKANTYTRFTALTNKGVKVRVLVSKPEEKLTVFSITNAKMSSVDISKLADTRAITLDNVGLSKFDFAPSTALKQLDLSRNNISEIDLSKYPNLEYLSMSDNKLTKLDLSKNKELIVVSLSRNNLTEVNFRGLTALESLDLTANSMTSLDCSRLPNLGQLFVSNNKLTSINVKNNAHLRALNLVANNLRFSALPPTTGSYRTSYAYQRQNPVDVSVNGNKVDLSSEAVIDGTPTVYRWFTGNVNVDKNGNLQGEEFDVDAEYTVTNGVTTLKLTKRYEDLVCVMTNAKFPKLLLHTKHIRFIPDATGIEGVNADNTDTFIKVVEGGIVVEAAAGSVVNVYGINGGLVQKAKMNGTSQSFSLPKGAYVVTINNKVAKVMVK